MTAIRGLRRSSGSAGLIVVVLLGLGPAGTAGVPPATAAAAAAATVTVVGPVGGLGPLGQTLPSGQPVAHLAVPGWGFPPGVQAGTTTVAGDGTVLVAGRDHHGGTGPPTGAAAVIGAYQPAGNTYHQVRLATTTTTTTTTTGSGAQSAPSVAGLATVADGDAVVFTLGASGDGAWPVLGVLSMADGQWQVAAGEGWSNQWTGAQLRSAGPPASELACPMISGMAGHSDCRGLGEVVSLPRSGDLIITQAGVSGRHNGALVAVRLTGPDAHGRFTVAVTGHYPYPVVRDPQTGDHLGLVLRDLRADPTGAAGDERFAVGVQALGDGEDRERPLVVQEFSYDADTGEITPVSAPTIPGDRAADHYPPAGYSAALYDHHGNLWAARHHGLAGGKLAIYTATGAGGALDRPDCPYDPAAPMESYLTTMDGSTVWGQACRPDYDLLQAQELTAVIGMVQDPAGDDVVALTLTGAMLPVRPSGSGEAMTFQIGNLVDSGLRSLPAALAEGSVREHKLGAFDPAGRLWLSGAQAQPDVAGAETDQWLYEVDVGGLFDPPPVALSDVPGVAATIQAGLTTSTGTERLAGPWASVDVDSVAYVRACGDNWSSAGCSFDGLPGNGFVLGHRSGYGHLGGEVEYRVEVPAAGRYRVAYRVHTFEVITEAAITLSVAGRGSHTTPIDTGGRWRTVPQPEPIELPAGVHTIRLAPPPGQGGWFLSWFTLQRA